MFAHIYKAAGGRFKLILTNTASISDGVITEAFYDPKALAKKAAKAFGATPWNY